MHWNVTTKQDRISSRRFASENVSLRRISLYGGRVESLIVLGGILIDQSQFDEALRAYERSLAIYRPPQHQRITVLLNSMATVYSHQGRDDLAQEKFDETSLNLSGEYHIETAGVLGSIVNALLMHEDFRGAIEPLQRSVRWQFTKRFRTFFYYFKKH